MGWMQELSIFRFLQGSRTTVLVWAGIFIAVIALVDWHFEDNISFGFLYLFPMLMAGGCLTRLQMAGVAAICTGLTEAFDPFLWTIPVGFSRLILTFAAFFGAGFYGFTSARNRRVVNRHLAEIETEAELRRKTEEQLDFLISSSPASIFTLDASGKVQLANDAAHRLLGVEKGNLQGQPIGQFFPALASVPPRRKRRSFTRKWSAGGGGKTAKYSWPTSGFRPTRRCPVPAWPRLCSTLRGAARPRGVQSAADPHRIQGLGRRVVS